MIRRDVSESFVYLKYLAGLVTAIDVEWDWVRKEAGLRCRRWEDET